MNDNKRVIEYPFYYIQELSIVSNVTGRQLQK